MLLVHHYDHATREVFGVIGDRGDHFVRRWEPPTVEALRVCHGTAPAQVLPDGVGIVDPLGISVIPVRGEILYGLLVSHFPVSYTHLRAHETVLDLVCR